MSLLTQLQGLNFGSHRALYYGMAAAATLGFFVALETGGFAGWLRRRKR